jgi:EAL domain-containing protein (putative c-di-GMP-specific phosphodiesterase class I)/GGDEF domain-containing protein
MSEINIGSSYMGMDNTVPINEGIALSFHRDSNILPEEILFSNKVERAILSARNTGSALAVFCLVSDGFKNVNFFGNKDEFARSSDALASAEKRLSDVLNKSDLLVWTGQDKCMILTQNMSDIGEVRIFADKLRAALVAHGAERRISASIGCAVYPLDGSSSELLIGNADVAALRAKNRGGNKLAFYSNATDGEMLDELKLTNGLFLALERDEFELYYQPQVDSRSDKIVGLEAMLRWNNPEEGLISPAKFLPVAEKTGLIMEIGEWVVRTACNQNKYWQEIGLPKLPVSVNLSIRQFEDGNMAEIIGDILNDTGLSAKSLNIEITETIAIKERDVVVEALKKLKKLGVGIAVDNFGTAHSSLNFISRLPVDTIKIDKCFIDGIGGNPKDEAVLRTVITLIRNLDLKAIAEGVETEQQVAFLAAEECYIIQGFYCYRPMSAENTEKLLSGVRRNLRQVIGGYNAEAGLVDMEVNDYLDAMGIKHSHSGYRYLVMALRLGVEDPKLIMNISGMYEKISKVYGKSIVTIDRAIRYSIRQDGHTNTNKEFISKAVDDIIGGHAYNTEASRSK